MKFTLTCNAATPVKGCKKAKRFDLPRDAAEDLVQAHASRQGLCSVCFDAGVAPKESQRTGRVVVESRPADPDEMITVVCWNRQCRNGEQVIDAYVKDGVVLREARVLQVAAKVRVARKDANGALCERCNKADKK